jgi:signal transduction histidine kinase
VLANETTLSQILINLLNNALKFVAPGVPPRVKFFAEERAGMVRLCVEDNGIGIAAEHHERIFRVFERLGGTRHEGTGIGLSIVRKGAERMGGRAGVESAPGQGSRFWVELPKAHDLPEAPANEP